MTPAMGLTTTLTALLLVLLFASAQEYRWLHDGWQFARASDSKFHADEERNTATTTITTKTTIKDVSGNHQTQSRPMRDRQEEDLRHENPLLQPPTALGEKTEAPLLGSSDAEQSRGFGPAVSKITSSAGTNIASYEKRFLKGHNKLLRQFMDSGFEKIRAKDQTLTPSDRNPPVKRFLKGPDYYLSMLAKYHQPKLPELISLTGSDANFQNLENGSENMSEKNLRRKRKAKRFSLKMARHDKEVQENKARHLQNSSNQHQKMYDRKMRVLNNSEDPSPAKSMAEKFRSEMHTGLAGDPQKLPTVDEPRRIPPTGDSYSNNEGKMRQSHILTLLASSSPDRYINVPTTQRRVRRHAGISDEDSDPAEKSEFDYHDPSDDIDLSDQSEFPLDKRFLRGVNPYLRPFFLGNPKKRFLKGSNPYWTNYRSLLQGRRFSPQLYTADEKRFPSTVDLYLQTPSYSPQKDRQDLADNVNSESNLEDGDSADSVPTLRIDKRLMKGFNPYLALYSTRLPMKITPTGEDDNDDIVFEKRFLRSPNRYLQSYAGRTTPKKKFNLLNWPGEKRSQGRGILDATQDPDHYFLEEDQRDQFHLLDKRFLKGVNPYLYAHSSIRGGYWNSQLPDTRKRFDDTEWYRQQSPITLPNINLAEEDDGTGQSLREKRFMKGVNQYFLKLQRGKRLLDGPDLYIQGQRLSREEEPDGERYGDDNEVVWEDGPVIPVKKRFMRGANQYLHSYNLNSKPEAGSLDKLRQDVGDRLVLEITRPLRSSLTGNSGLSPHTRLGWELKHRLSGWPALVSRQFYPSFG